MSRPGRRGYRSPFRAGILMIITLVVLTFVAFTKDNPLTRDFRVNVVVQDAAGVKPGSPVRIAGVDVGSVEKIQRYHGAEAALITMGIKPAGLPLQKDSRVRIRPRLFLEGNFVLDVSPGTPGTATLQDGDTIPITQTTRAVQLDQLFNELQGPERESLQIVVQQLGVALGGKDPKDPNALAKGQTAGQSLNDTIKAGAATGKDVERVMRALQGQDRGDLAAAITSLAQLSSPLADEADNISRLIDGLDRTVSVFAENQAAVSAGVQRLPQTMQVAERQLPKIRAALPPITAVSENVTKALPRTPSLVKASGPFLTQTSEFLSADEAGALSKSIEPITADLARSAPELAGILTDLDRIDVCTTDVLVPTANSRITKDFDSGLTIWEEFLRTGSALASGGQNFDANGAFARAAAAQGVTLQSGVDRNSGSSRKQVGVANAQPTSTIPKFPANTKLTSDSAPWNFNTPCTAKMKPSLNSVPVGSGDGQP